MCVPGGGAPIVTATAAAPSMTSYGGEQEYSITGNFANEFQLPPLHDENHQMTFEDEEDLT
jgi:hypothetical protein